MNAKPRIAILGDFPLGKVTDRYETMNFNAGWLYCLFQLLQEIDEFDIHWIIVDKNIKEYEQLEVGNQTFHVAPGTGLTVGQYTGYIYNRWQVSRIIRRIKPCLFHGWGTERFYGLSTKDFHGKSLLSIQGILTAYGQRAKISSFECRQRFYEKIAIKSVDYITTESQWARERILEMSPKSKIFLWEYAPQDIFFKITRNLSSTPSCLFAGTHTPVKDVPTVVEAFSIPELSHVKLYLAGVNPHSIPNLPANIIPLGKVTREEIARLLGAVWCLVHPSLADSSPNIVKEARVAGVPAIVTTECGGKQYVEHGKSGFVIKSKSSDELAASVLDIVSSKERSLRMGEYKQDLCRQLLSLDTMKKGIINIYRDIIG